MEKTDFKIKTGWKICYTEDKGYDMEKVEYFKIPLAPGLSSFLSSTALYYRKHSSSKKWRRGNYLFCSTIYFSKKVALSEIENRKKSDLQAEKLDCISNIKENVEQLEKLTKDA